MSMCMNMWQCLCVFVHSYACVSEAYEEVVVPVFQKMKHGIGRKKGKLYSTIQVPYCYCSLWGYILKNAVQCETVMHGITHLMETWYVHYCLVNTRGLFRDLLEWCWCAWLDVGVVRQYGVHGKGETEDLVKKEMISDWFPFQMFLHTCMGAMTFSVLCLNLMHVCLKWSTWKKWSHHLQSGVLSWEHC
jgi:hypothetical protein